MRKNLPAQWMITDHKTVDALKAAEKLERNSGIILRDYDLSAAKKLHLGLALKDICVRKHLCLLVANDPQLAIRINADGIHLPEYAAAKIRFWRGKKPRWMITASAHSRYAAKYAMENGADAVMISSIFATSSHPEKDGLGILKAAKYIPFAAGKPLPAYALGGVNANHVKVLKMAGFKGFAAISAFRN